MAFSIAGNIITQSGTDNDLSGLAAIAGVTVSAQGVGGQRHASYNIGDRRLIINGTMSHNPDTEQLKIGDGIAAQSVLVNGAYNYGVETDAFGHLQRSTGLGLIITRAANSNFDDPVLDITAGGTFNWFGGVISSAGTVYFRDGATVDIRDAVANIQNDSGGHLIRSFTSDLSMSGLRKIGGGFILYRAPTSFLGYVPVHSDLSPQAAGRKDYALLLYGPPLGTSDTIPVRDFSGLGNPNEIAFIDGSRGKIINPENGSDTTFGGWLGTGNNRSDTYIEITKELEINFTNLSGASIDVVTYISDDDSGDRLNQQGFNNLDTKIHKVTSSAGTSDFEVVNGIVNVLNGVNDSLVDKRFNDNIATARFISYGYSISQTTINLLGTGKRVTNWTLFDDTVVTEQSKSIVVAYTSIDKAQQFYDRALSFLEDNFNNEQETIVTRSGNDIDAGSYDVVIDATAAQPFAFDGSTITIKSAAYVGLIKTTGAVSVINGATQSGGIIDAGGIKVGITTVDGTPFNILARRTDTGAEFPFQEGITSASFQVPFGVSLEYAIWQKGKQTLIGTLDPSVSTSLIAAPLGYDVVDISLDVAVLLEDIDVVLTPTDYSIVFNEPMVLNIEQVKIIIHFVLSRETSLRAGLATGAGNPTLTIRSDEIQVNLPTIFLRRGSNVPLTERVELTGFLNTDPAKVMNPAYVINPSATDGTFVLLPSVKPQLDAAQLAKAVWDEERGRFAVDFARGANEQTKKRVSG